MLKIQKNILIGKAAQAVWAVLDDPARSSSLAPTMKLLYCYESRVGGYDRVLRCDMGGKSFEISTEMTVYIHQRHMTYKTLGAFQSCWYWWLETDGRQTHVSLTVDYDVPRGLAGDDPRNFEQEMSRAIETQLANLKQAVEAGG